MGEEKRTGDKPIADNVKRYMNDAQLAELHKIKKGAEGSRIVNDYPRVFSLNLV